MKIKKTPFWTASKKLDTIWGIFMERKVKYDLAFRLKCVQEFLENNTTINILSNREEFDESSLRK